MPLELQRIGNYGDSDNSNSRNITLQFFFFLGSQSKNCLFVTKSSMFCWRHWCLLKELFSLKLRIPLLPTRYNSNCIPPLIIMGWRMSSWVQDPSGCVCNLPTKNKKIRTPLLFKKKKLSQDGGKYSLSYPNKICEEDGRNRNKDTMMKPVHWHRWKMLAAKMVTKFVQCWDNCRDGNYFINKIRWWHGQWGVAS